MAAPDVVLVHGWGGSFARTWVEPGWVALLEDAGRRVIGVDLLGHGTAPKPHDPAAYADLTARVVEALPDEPVDAVGFSLGAMTLLELAVQRPERLNRLALLGIGESVFRADEERLRAIVAAVEGRGEVDDIGAQLFGQYARQPGNDREALSAVLRRPARRLGPGDFATVTMPTLLVLGGRQRRTDHFATTESFAAIDAVLAFLGAQPA
jgi:pimeloyl-ACP methyl ester carboxylesterase